ncbi:MAG: hypothetical protein ACYC4J_10080, partial [Gemmatimonadaceae bacterium]
MMSGQELEVLIAPLEGGTVAPAGGVGKRRKPANWNCHGRSVRPRVAVAGGIGVMVEHLSQPQ